jgi:hypothetical protein
MYILTSKERKVVYIMMQHVRIPCNQFFFSSLKSFYQNPVRFIDVVEVLALQTIGFSVQTIKGSALFDINSLFKSLFVAGSGTKAKECVSNCNGFLCAIITNYHIYPILEGRIHRD